MLPENFIKNTTTAIRHLDDVEAKKLIKELEQFVISQNIKQTDPSLLQELEKLRVQLKLTAIPQLTEEETAEVLREHYLDAFNAGIDMENRLTVRLFYVPEIPRDRLREKLKKAVMENRQKIGALTIGQWIAEFEKNYEVKTRTLAASVDFVRANRNSQSLTPAEKEKLKELIHTYDYFLVTTLPATGAELNAIINTPLPQNFTSQNTSSEYPTYEQTTHSVNTRQPVADNRDWATAKVENEIQTEKLSLPLALKKYPEINEQLITSNRIRIKSFSEPARPSVKNWLSDYTFTMGFDAHDSAARGIYLFRNENTKILNAPDKARLNYLLKAFDTNESLEINLTLKQIIFPRPETGEETKKNLETPKIDSTPQPAIEKDRPTEISTRKVPLKGTFIHKPLTSQEKVLPRSLSASPKPPLKPGLYGTFTLSQKDMISAPLADSQQSALQDTRLPSARNAFSKTPVTSAPANLPTAPGGKISENPVSDAPKIEFTSPQKLPFEKQQSPLEKSLPDAKSAQSEVKVDADAPLPIKITPIHFKKDPRSEDIIDLKK